MKLFVAIWFVAAASLDLDEDGVLLLQAKVPEEVQSDKMTSAQARRGGVRIPTDVFPASDQVKQPSGSALTSMTEMYHNQQLLAPQAPQPPAPGTHGYAYTGECDPACPVFEVSYSIVVTSADGTCTESELSPGVRKEFGHSSGEWGCYSRPRFQADKHNLPTNFASFRWYIKDSEAWYMQHESDCSSLNKQEGEDHPTSADCFVMRSRTVDTTSPYRASAGACEAGTTTIAAFKFHGASADLQSVVSYDYTSDGYKATLTGWTHVRDYHKGVLRNKPGSATAIVSGLEPARWYKYRMYQYTSQDKSTFAGTNGLLVNGQRREDTVACTSDATSCTRFSPSSTGVALSTEAGLISFEFERKARHVALSGIDILSIGEVVSITVNGQKWGP